MEACISTIVSSAITGSSSLFAICAAGFSSGFCSTVTGEMAFSWDRNFSLQIDSIEFWTLSARMSFLFTLDMSLFVFFLFTLGLDSTVTEEMAFSWDPSSSLQRGSIESWILSAGFPFLFVLDFPIFFLFTLGLGSSVTWEMGFSWDPSSLLQMGSAESWTLSAGLPLLFTLFFSLAIFFLFTLVLSSFFKSHDRSLSGALAKESCVLPESLSSVTGATMVGLSRTLSRSFCDSLWFCTAMSEFLFLFWLHETLSVTSAEAFSALPQTVPVSSISSFAETWSSWIVGLSQSKATWNTSLCCVAVSFTLSRWVTGSVPGDPGELLTAVLFSDISSPWVGLSIWGFVGGDGSTREGSCLLVTEAPLDVKFSVTATFVVPSPRDSFTAGGGIPIFTSSAWAASACKLSDFEAVEKPSCPCGSPLAMEVGLSFATSISLFPRSLLLFTCSSCSGSIEIPFLVTWFTLLRHAAATSDLSEFRSVVPHVSFWSLLAFNESFSKFFESCTMVCFDDASLLTSVFITGSGFNST